MPTQTFPLTGPINLNARIGQGTLTVTAVDDLSEAVVTLTARSAKDASTLDRIVVGMNGRTLEVLTPREGGLADFIGTWKRDRDLIDAEITVPTGTAVKLMTFTADITVNGRIGGADIATGTGTITASEVDGDLRLRLGAADSRVDRVTGSVVVRSGSGDAAFGEVGGDLHAGFGSGDLAADVVHGSSRLRAGSGSLRLGAVHGDVDFTCGSGEMSIGLPAGVSARLDVRTGSGRVRSELPIEDDRTGSGPSIAVRARTGSGDVRLFRAASAA
jgi:hypothetical protein